MSTFNTPGNILNPTHNIPPKQNLKFVFIKQRTNIYIYAYYISPLIFIEI